jgi:putative membrane protein
MFDSKFFNSLLALYSALFIVLAIEPVDRPTWFAENFTVWLLIATMLILRAQEIYFSNTAYAMMFVLVYLHTIGGHWTFANVPFNWVTDFFGFQRNHFDRIAHFSVGLYAFAIVEWLHRRQLVANRFLLFAFPVCVIASVAAMYEIIEWLYAALANPEAGIAYLGSQGDIWDAQKDMLADTFGALVATRLYFLIRKPEIKP